MAEAAQGAVLSRSEIIKNIELGNITVEPYDPKAISAASIDLTLSHEFRYYKPGNKVVRVTEETNYEDITVKVEVPPGEGYLLLPGQLCLGITTENIKLAPGICGLLEGRSRFARLGLLVHITAGFMNPGINNRQVLEIFNASNQPLELIPGTKICQFIFLRMAGEASYEGHFQTQKQL
jgi:dCTP deaminase